ncbi:MAG: ferritin-like domain-containing protein [Deltaproteobacteria bacterium]|nr:ferritin-like domain-containing protein [Deltaproteobacteria bacterium]
MTRRVIHVGEPFAGLHRALVGVEIPWDALDPGALDPQLRAAALDAWGYRAQTELRSVQTMTRFLTEVLGAGDPLEVYAGAADAVQDEIRHAALCVGMVERLGGVARLPEPVAEPVSAEFLGLPLAQRALATAVSMLAVSETISVALIEDLRARCGHPTVAAVLGATLADEDHHRDYGWAYVAASLDRFDADGREYARFVAEHTLAPHRDGARALVATLRPGARHRDAWPEPELAEVGLLSPAREALVKLDVIERVLAPRLGALGIATPSP